MLTAMFVLAAIGIIGIVLFIALAIGTVNSKKCNGQIPETYQGKRVYSQNGWRNI